MNSSFQKLDPNEENPILSLMTTCKEMGKANGPLKWPKGAIQSPEALKDHLKQSDAWYVCFSAEDTTARPIGKPTLPPAQEGKEAVPCPIGSVWCFDKRSNYHTYVDEGAIFPELADHYSWNFVFASKEAAEKYIAFVKKDVRALTAYWQHQAMCDKLEDFWNNYDCDDSEY